MVAGGRDADPPLKLTYHAARVTATAVRSAVRQGAQGTRAHHMELRIVNTAQRFSTKHVVRAVLFSGILMVTGCSGDDDAWIQELERLSNESTVDVDQSARIETLAINVLDDDDHLEDLRRLFAEADRSQHTIMIELVGAMARRTRDTIYVDLINSVIDNGSLNEYHTGMAFAIVYPAFDLSVVGERLFDAARRQSEPDDDLSLSAIVAASRIVEKHGWDDHRDDMDALWTQVHQRGWRESGPRMFIRVLDLAHLAGVLADSDCCEELETFLTDARAESDSLSVYDWLIEEVRTRCCENAGGD
jgi:hypothetical protein